MPVSIIGKCRVVITKGGKLTHKHNALDTLGSANIIASFLASAAPLYSAPMTPDLLTLDDSTETSLISTFTAAPITLTSDIPIEDTPITDGTLIVGTTTTLTYTGDAATPASVVFTVAIPVAFFPSAAQSLASIAIKNSSTGTPFSRVVFDSPISVDITTGLSIEYTYLIVPAGA